MAKIIITYGVPTEGLSALKEHKLRIPPLGEAFSKEELLPLLADADAVLACKGFDREMIEASPMLKLIVCYGAGYDSIDIAAATQHGILVCNTPDCVTAPTAELAIAHILALSRRVVELDRLARNESPENLFVMGKRMGASLEGGTLGVVGMGRIGAKVADFGRLMGMRVLYTARSAKPERDQLGDERVSLATLMSQSDFVTLHCPLTNETRGMISKEHLALMKPTAFLINTARGGVIDEHALLETLQSRRIAGAGLDVYANEPQIDPSFFALDNVLLTPHVGSNTYQARYHMACAAAERILDALAGRVPKNVLNPEALNK